MKESLILLPLFRMTYFALNCGLSAVRVLFFFLLELDLDLVTVIYSNNIKIAIVISLGVSLAVRKNL